MTNLFRYSGLATKIRAMQSHMLTSEDYDNMVHMPTIKDLAIYLKNCPAYKEVLKDLDENSLHRGQIEQKLIFSMYMDYVKIYKFTSGNDRRFLDTYFLFFEIEIIKIILRMVFDSREVEYDLMDFEQFFIEHSNIDINKLSKSNNINEFVECLKNTDYYNILSLLYNGENITLFDIEMRLDIYYFSRTWKLRHKYLDKTNQLAITESLGAKMDLLNILWIYRAKTYYNIDKEIIYSYLLPIRYKLKKHQIRQLVDSKSVEELRDEIGKTYYGKIMSNFEDNNPERNYNLALERLLEKAKINYPMTLAPVRYFMHYKEMEISNVTKIVESIRYNLAPDKIKQNINLNDE